MKKYTICSALAMALLPSFVLGEVHDLGVITVESNASNTQKNMFESMVSSKDISLQNTATVGEALGNMSGISETVVGARGESGINIRGFDAKRVGIFIDGIPVYVPYDGNFDFARFLSGDISRIDVSKGFSSVMFGGNTMGGAVNIVSKKPTKDFEGSIKTGIVFDNDGDKSSQTTSLNLGTKQDNFYAQLNAQYNDRDHYAISDDFKGSTSQPAGDRLRSEATDRKVSLKAGYVNDNNDEISFNYLNQHGVKQQAPSINADYGTVRYWDWPFWDKETFSIMGRKNFENSYIKALVYHDIFNNSLYGYDDNSYTTMTKKSSFKSEYNDHSNGARLEYGHFFENNFLNIVLDYKQDVHKGYDKDKTTDVKTLTENYEDHTISFGIEDNYQISDDLELFMGANYIFREADKIYDTNTAYLNMLDLQKQHVFNPQVALVYDIDNSSKVKGSIAKKTYLPSMKDRYSRKFNTTVPNPTLENEEATHYELSYQKNIDNLGFKVNGFLTKVDDAIQSVVYEPTPTLQQNQNIGSFEHKGVELEANYKIDGLEAGANYTFLDITNKSDSNVKVTYVPKNEIFAYLKKDLANNIWAYGDVKYRSGSYQQNSTTKNYDKIASFTTFDIKAIYEPIETISLEAGIKNLNDKLYYYDMAYPQAGREYFLNASYKF